PAVAHNPIAVSRSYFTNIGSASSCQFGVVRAGNTPVVSRPLVGYLNLNPASPLIRLADTLQPAQFNMIIRTLLHEMIRALGFHESLISSWLTPSGDSTYAYPTEARMNGNVSITKVALN